MSIGFQQAPEGLRAWVNGLLDALARFLGMMDDGEIAESPVHLEGAVGLALQPVAPSDSFRSQLLQNLSRAAESRGGITVEDTRPYRRALLVGLTAAMVVAGVIVAAVIYRAREARGGR